MNKTRLAQVEKRNQENELIKRYSILESQNIDAAEFIKTCHIKRFYERWSADKEFRNKFTEEPYKTVDMYKIQVDPEEIRPLWDLKYTEIFDDQQQVSKSVERFQKLFIEGTREDKSRDSLPSINHLNFQTWREREIARCNSQFHPTYHDAIAHVPMCFELSKGCSVGCWFCGISAPRLGDIFTYESENAKLWREVIELMKVTFGIGTAAGNGFCYWATDPLDNPDYEKFCIDFYEILGTFPQTTTAQAWKYPERVKALLKLSMEKGGEINRFSILSLKIFNKIHEQFSAEELAAVNLVLQNPEALSSKATAGKTLGNDKLKADKNPEQESIACVSGFLFNMVEKSVKLISPCPANERWPNGYIIYDEGTFSDADSLKILLEEMIAKNMSLSVRYGDVIRFRRDLKYENLPDGFQLSTKYLTRKFRNQPYLKELGEVIQQGDKTAKEIVLFFESLGVPEINTLYSLNLLFSKGVLDEEPQSNESKINAKPEVRLIP